MANKRGRKSVYGNKVQPYFSYIKKWLVNGATEEQVAKQLDIGYSTWNNFKAEKDDLIELLEDVKKERIVLVEDLKGALVKAALGYEFKESKEFIEADDSGTLRKKKEVYTKYAQPNPTAIFGALNIYDENFINNKAQYRLREKELNLKIKQAENEMAEWEPMENE